MPSSSPAGLRRARIWLFPLAILLGFALSLFVLVFWVDAEAARHPLEVFLRPHPETALETLMNASEVMAGVLAISLTVVAIIVELAANRYTHRVTELFISTPTNFFVLGFFVVTALMCLWVGLSFEPSEAASRGFVPYLGITVSIGMLSTSLLLLLPYFAFVFDFLSPHRIIDRIRRHAMGRVRSSRLAVEQRQAEAVRGIEQIADIGFHAMENKDKGVSMGSVDALAAMVSEYQEIRSSLPDAWYRLEGALSSNPDFVSLSPAVREKVTERRVWFEMKVFRQYQTLHHEALHRMREVSYVIAIHTRELAQAAHARGHNELHDLTIKFFNTFLRATITAQDVRTAYNVLHQYRLLAEAVLDAERGTRAVEIARYFKYYGLQAYAAKLPFVLETVAYDLCSLIETAFARKSPAVRELLRIFLEVDKESESDVQEASLRGVRKAQIKLAAGFLEAGEVELARLIFRDMEHERRERLASIRDELLGVRSAEFWEVSDRGMNFDFLPPERKRRMMEFFEWFGGALPEVRHSRMPIAPPPETTERTSRIEPPIHESIGAGADPANESIEPPRSGELSAPAARLREGEWGG